VLDPECAKVLGYLQQLNPTRADNDNTWLHVGMILHGMDHSRAMFDAWERWSRNREHHDFDVCVEKWRSFAKDHSKPRTLSTLVTWAREDAHEETARGLTLRPAPDERSTPTPSAMGAASGPADPVLRLIQDAWPTLPEAVKTGIVAMVRAAREDGTDSTRK